MANLQQVTSYLDKYLKTKSVADWPNAFNGLQIENSGRITKIGAAVDACAFTIRQAIEKETSLLIVHHGLFWRGVEPVKGAAFQKIKMAMENDLAIYSSHLPLDLHPVVGNNAQLCAALGLKKTRPFFREKGQFIGLKADMTIGRAELAQKLEAVLLSRVKVCPGGPKVARKIGVVTGGAGSEVYKAAEEGVDTFITGEGPHWSYIAAEELGINLIYAGHYATETFGVNAIASHLSRRIKVPWEFIDHPTGM